MGELERRPNAWALTPLVVFLLTYLVVSIVAGDFYKMPITVAFVISSIVAMKPIEGTVFCSPEPGFSIVSASKKTLELRMIDKKGNVLHTVTRIK